MGIMGVVLRVLFVCGGNTCRSPMAQAIAQSFLGETALVESAGVDAYPGEPANPKAIEVMCARSLDIRGHRSRAVEDLDLTVFDVIVALRPQIANQLKLEFGVEASRLKELNIEDPYTKGRLEDYQQCLIEIETALRLQFE